MTQNNYLSNKQIKKISPHIDDYFRAQYSEAIDRLLKSKKFLKLSDSYILTEEYGELLKSFGDDPATIITNHIKDFVDKYYDESKDGDFNWWLRNTMSGLNFLFRQFNLQYFNIWGGDDKYTLENYEDLLIDNIDTNISDQIERHQVQFAKNEIGLNHHIAFKNWTKLKAVLATAQCASLEEIEQLVSNSFDFDELIIQQ